MIIFFLKVPPKSKLGRTIRPNSKFTSYAENEKTGEMYFTDTE